jgi:hypothetical protein
MGANKPFSWREKEYIRKHAKDKFRREIATDLGDLYPKDNGGSRSALAVLRFIQREKLDA